MSMVKSWNMHYGRSCLLDKGVWQETALTCPFFLADSRSLFLPVTIANKDVKDG